MKEVKTAVLVIRDGWGINKNPDQDKYNAVKLAKTPISDNLSKNFPRTELAASGIDVGVPEGVIGNSEVGHQNIGAGRIVDQEIIRIEKFFKSQDAAKNSILNKAIDHCVAGQGRLHLIGLLSDSGVHSMNTHLYEFLNIIKNKKIATDVLIHVITDGRDSPPRNGIKYIKELEDFCDKIGLGKIASICGRYWAMDRDNRWERTQKAYQCFTDKTLERDSITAQEVVESFYASPTSDSEQGDEFILPVAIKVKDIGNSRIASGDSVIFYNFRGDRPRQIVQAFVDRDFKGFAREYVEDLIFCTLTNYKEGLCENVILEKPPKMKNILGQVVSDSGVKQFRCAETEKYPHVTFFFNDYREEPFPGEDRKIVPSPKDVATYDQKPQMSAFGVRDAVVEAIKSKQYGLIIVNFANPDMVGHTGKLDATIKAVEVVDECLKDILNAIDGTSSVALITADHGNAEIMWNETTDTPQTQHTLNLVEAVLYGQDLKSHKLKERGRLADIAPTLLHLLNIDQPREMTGENLII